MKAPGSPADDLSVCCMAIGYEFAAHLGLLLLLTLLTTQRMQGAQWNLSDLYA